MITRVSMPSSDTSSPATLENPCKLCHEREATPGLRTCPTCRGEGEDVTFEAGMCDVGMCKGGACGTMLMPPKNDALKNEAPKREKAHKAKTPSPSRPIPSPSRPASLQNLPIQSEPSIATSTAPPRPLTGISLEAQEKWEQARAGSGTSTRKPPPNKKPREKVYCACGCGKAFARVIGGYWESRKYYNAECKRRHFKPNFGWPGDGSGGEKNGGKPEKYTITPEGDELIKQLYAEKVGMDRKSHVKALAEQLGVPPWKVSRRASALGVLFSPRAEAPWSEEELACLKENAHWSPVVIARNMRKAGFQRSATAIKIKMTRLGGKEVVLNGESFTSRGLGRLFGVDSQAVVRWIDRGLLIAERMGTARTEAQHGDIWRIKREDVRRFVLAHVNVIDFRKIADRWWFVELVAGVGGNGGGGGRDEGR